MKTSIRLALATLTAVALLSAAVSGGLARATAASSPTIASVSNVVNQQDPVIIIRGSGFGNGAPSNDLYVPARTPYFRLSRPGGLLGVGGWQAGYPGDACTANIGMWTDTELIMTPNVNGLLSLCPINTGDTLTVEVWNTGDPGGIAASQEVHVVASGPTPTVKSVAANFGPAGGGTFAAPDGTVTISGSGFNNASVVWFGAFPTTKFSASSDASISATPPPSTIAEGVQVRVTTDKSTSSPSFCPVIQLGCVDAYFYLASAFGAPWKDLHVPVSVSHTFSPASGIDVVVNATGSVTLNGDLNVSSNGPLPSAFTTQGQAAIDLTNLSVSVTGTLSTGDPIDIPLPVSGLPDVVTLNLRLAKASLSGTITASVAMSARVDFQGRWIPGSAPQMSGAVACKGSPVSSPADFAQCITIQPITSSLAASLIMSPLWLKVGPDLGLVKVDAGIGPIIAFGAAADSSGSFASDICAGLQGTAEAKIPSVGVSLTTGDVDLLGPYNMLGSGAQCPIKALADPPLTSGTRTAYIYDFGSGINDPGFPGSSIFRNAITGGPIGSGETGSYNGATFSNVPLSAIEANPTAALTGYDNIVLYEVCSIGDPRNSAALNAINTFLDNGGKVLLFDGDGCSANSGGRGIADYSQFAFPFTTSSPGPRGAVGYTYGSVEASTLTSGLSNGVDFGGDAVGDANVFTSNAGGWCKSIMTTNSLAVTGNVQSYARTISGGLAIYEGEDFWYTDGPTSHLKNVFDLMLTQQHGPDGLPCSNPASGIKLNLNTLAGTSGSSITVVASVVDSNGQPLDGVTVNFTIASGPDAGMTGSSVTDPGQALFTFTNTKGPGVDIVEASFNDGAGVAHRSNRSQITWTAPAAKTPMPSTTATTTSTATPEATPTRAPLRTHTPSPPTATPAGTRTVVRATSTTLAATATPLRAVLGAVRLPDTGSSSGDGLHLDVAIIVIAVAGTGSFGLAAYVARRRRRAC